MSEVKYRFINRYGLPVLDDSPMESKKADAYFDFLEEDMKKEEARKERADAYRRGQGIASS